MGEGEDALVSSFPGQVIFSPFELSSSMEGNTMLLFDRKIVCLLLSYLLTNTCGVKNSILSTIGDLYLFSEPVSISTRLYLTKRSLKAR